MRRFINWLLGRWSDEKIASLCDRDLLMSSDREPRCRIEYERRHLK